MRTVGQITLSIFFLIFFVFVTITATFKFMLLNHDVWISVFEKNKVYTNLSVAIKNTVNQQVGLEGGNKNDVAILTDLITPENTRDFVNNNLYNFIDFVNGKSGELIVYVPISKAPKDLLPKSIAVLNNEMTLSQLSERFNIVGLERLPMRDMSRVGLTVSYLFVGSTISLFVVLTLMYFLTENGQHFIAVGITLFLSAFLTFFMSVALKNLNENVLTGSVSADLVNVILKTAMPPFVNQVVVYGMYVAFALAVLGILICLIKKPGYK